MTLIMSSVFIKKNAPYKIKTLKRWYYEQEDVVKNDNIVTNKNNTKNNDEEIIVSIMICDRCGKNPVEINRLGKPAGPKSPPKRLKPSMSCKMFIGEQKTKNPAGAGMNRSGAFP